MHKDKINPVISVVMPAYNAEKYIKESIDSVLNQTFDDFELIIVDDGSRDSTREIVHQYSDPRIRYIYQENSGAAAARNTGIKRSKGEYIAFIDSDDIWIPYKLDKQLKKFEFDPDLGLVYGWVQSIYPDGSPKLVTKPLYEGWVYRDLLLKNFQHNGSLQLIKKECLNHVGLFDEQLRNVQDYDLWLRLARNYKFGVVRDIMVKYRYLPNSLSRQHKNMHAAHKIIMKREFQFADKSIQKLKGKIYSDHCYSMFRICYYTNNDKLEAQKYLLLSFLHSPINFIGKFNLKKVISYFKFILPDKISV